MLLYVAAGIRLIKRYLQLYFLGGRRGFRFYHQQDFCLWSKSWAAGVLLHEIPTFLSARLLSLGVELLGMWLLVDCAHIPYAISKILMNVLVILINYVLSKLVIFKKKT